MSTSSIINFIFFTEPIITKDKRARESTDATVDSVWNKSNDANSTSSLRLSKPAGPATFECEKSDSITESNALDADIETASLSTQLSVDDENFFVLDEDDSCLFDEIFPLQNPVAGDLAEEANATPNSSEESRKVLLEKCVVLRFSLEQVRMQLSSRGLLSLTDLVCCKLNAEEVLSCTRQQFCETFRVKEMAVNRSTDWSTPEWLYPLRVTMKNCDVALDSYVVDAFVNDLEFTISNDSLANLVAFVQDEKALYASSIRTKLNLKSVRLKITDRRNPDPVCILLNSGTILQGPWGDDASNLLTELHRKDAELRRANQENESLKRQLQAALERLHL
ncbi:hypothetical protein TTRE_0000282601 [Trichuris trichiura]|uniref:Uncharacterized protein n=1 Tax=Trichuris trichiura TaxID=36087 RepID=A0A077Z3E3_TRITR|nr:hypothetical protein TTRE_0000282601 [Trichuris trichiura]